jgi:hypothetical protein
MDDETAQWVRIEAARRDSSVSRWVAQLLRQQMTESSEYEQARRSYESRQPSALKSPADRYPDRADLYER